MAARHETYLGAAITAGTVLLACRTQDADSTAFGIVILQAASGGEARGILEADPFVAEGVASAQLFPYKIAYVAERISPGNESVGADPRTPEP